MADGRSIAFQPHAGPQTWLIQAQVTDILCGGARGGGKTFGMLGAWLQHQQLYGKDAKGIWFRRSQPEIEGAQAEMLKLFPQVGAVYEVQARTWLFPSGARLKLRYLESDSDASRYQGHDASLLFFDDAGTWPSPKPIDFLRGILRSSAGVPCRMISSANPCGAGHEFLKARYLDPSPPMVPFLAHNPDFPDLPPIQRVFIPSKLKDNPSLDAASYSAQLALAGPAHIVKAWLEGDWDATPEGGMLDPAWFENVWEVQVDRMRISGTRVICSVDPAEDVGKGNDETGIVIAIRHGYYCDLLHAEAVKMLLEPLEARLDVLCKAYGVDKVLIEKKSVGGPLAQNLKRRANFNTAVEAVDPGQQNKAERMWAQAPWFQGARVRLPAPKVRPILPIVSDWPDYVREMTRFTGDKAKRERDNRVDATSQLLKQFSSGGASSLFEW